MKDEDKYIIQNYGTEIVPHGQIAGQQPTRVKPGKTIINIEPTLDGKYVQIMFPHRLEAIEGLWITRQEAIDFARLLYAAAEKVRG